MVVFREERRIEDGIILECDRIVVSPSLRPNILKTIHQGHLGMESAFSEPVPLSIGQESQLTLPSLSASVKLPRNTRRERKRNHCYSQSCHAGRRRLNSDVFEYRGHQYLLLSDHYSKFPLITKLSGISSLATINHMKSILLNMEFLPSS